MLISRCVRRVTFSQARSRRPPNAPAVCGLHVRRATSSSLHSSRVASIGGLLLLLRLSSVPLRAVMRRARDSFASAGPLLGLACRRSTSRRPPGHCVYEKQSRGFRGAIARAQRAQLSALGEHRFAAVQCLRPAALLLLPDVQLRGWAAAVLRGRLFSRGSKTPAVLNWSRYDSLSFLGCRATAPDAEGPAVLLSSLLGGGGPFGRPARAWRRQAGSRLRQVRGYALT